MKDKRNVYAFLACILGADCSNAADSEKKFKKVRFADEPQSTLRIDVPKMPQVKQKISDIKSPLERSPRYDGVLQSPVLSNAGLRVLESSPRISYAGVKLRPLVSARSGFGQSLIDIKNK